MPLRVHSCPVGLGDLRASLTPRALDWGGVRAGGWVGGQRPCPSLLLNLDTDIGHVDFLEKVHGLAERPYVIAGLHFDQVTPGRLGVGPSRGFSGWGWAQARWRAPGVAKTGRRAGPLPAARFPRWEGGC